MRKFGSRIHTIDNQDRSEVNLSRHAARERVLQTLFQMDMNEMEAPRAVAYTHDIVGAGEYDVAYFSELLNGVIDHLTFIDDVINRYSQDWLIERMPGVDRNILRIGIYELTFASDTPAAVALNEAVELCKSFGTERSAKFVNGVLAGVLRDVDDVKKQSVRDV